MKKLILIATFLISLSSVAQSHQAFEDGEWFQFRIHYGPFNASFATLEVDETTLNGIPVYHVTGKGKSTGLLHWFFKVDDNYETYINKMTGTPVRFVRQIDEGGYIKDIQIDFNHRENTALVFDREHNTKKVFEIENNVQDMLSAFYYLRNNLEVDNLEEGDVVNLNMFFDNENYDFQLKFLGREVLDTKFGKI
ncbi:MAG TPA: DUF3108 domain-containing protein, partial [Salinimicrobium sp.]|nr:DUF3108 domain-containing protein [Salinimicrobium sp.]